MSTTSRQRGCPRAVAAEAAAPFSEPLRNAKTATEEMRQLNLRFALSGIDFSTRVPVEEAPGHPLTVARLRELLLERGLVSCAEQVLLMGGPPNSTVIGRPSCPLPDDDAVLGDTIWVLQEKPHLDDGVHVR